MSVEPRTKHPILLVDDEPEILYSLKGLLRREFELHTAEDGRQALEILRQHPIHVIMTDQRMPEMSGVELMGHARTEHPDAIRIIFTGYADIKAVVDAINNGRLFRYITKPWDPDELIGLLHEAAAEYDRVAERRQLVDDVCRHVEAGQRLAQRLLAADSGCDSADASQFIESGSQLLERLKQQKDLARDEQRARAADGAG